MTLLIVLGVAGLGVLLIAVGFFMWFSRWYVNRNYSNRPTVETYKPRDVYRDRDGFEWEVVDRRQMRLVGSINSLPVAAANVAENFGPLTLVHEAGEES